MERSEPQTAIWNYIKKAEEDRGRSQPNLLFFFFLFFQFLNVFSLLLFEMFHSWAQKRDTVTRKHNFFQGDLSLVKKTTATVAPLLPPPPPVCVTVGR